MKIEIIVTDFKNKKDYTIKTNCRYKIKYSCLGDYVYFCKILGLENQGVNLQDIAITELYINGKKIYIDGVRFEQKSYHGLQYNIYDFFNTIESLEDSEGINTDFINTVLDEANCGYFGKIEGSDFESVIKAYKEYLDYIEFNDHITFDKYIGNRPSWVHPYDN